MIQDTNDAISRPSRLHSDGRSRENEPVAPNLDDLDDGGVERILARRRRYFGETDDKGQTRCKPGAFPTSAEIDIAEGGPARRRLFETPTE